MTQESTVGLNCCDVKIEANSKSYNTSVHVYEFATKERIDTVIDNAIYAMQRTQYKILKEIIEKK